MLERYIRFVDRVSDEIFMGPPRSVGIIAVANVFDESGYPGYQTAILKLPEHPTDKRSRYVYHVPVGWVQGGATVEVLIRRIEPIPFMARAIERLDIITMWLTAIRPFDRTMYGKPIDRNDTVLSEMFRVNRREVYF